MSPCSGTKELRFGLWDRAILVAPKAIGSSRALPKLGMADLVDSLRSKDPVVVNAATRALENVKANH